MPLGMRRCRINLPNRCYHLISRVAHRAFEGWQAANRKGRAAMTRKTYCGNLLWQSSLTLLVPLRGLRSRRGLEEDSSPAGATRRARVGRPEGPGRSARGVGERMEPAAQLAGGGRVARVSGRDARRAAAPASAESRTGCACEVPLRGGNRGGRGLA